MNDCLFSQPAGSIDALTLDCKKVLHYPVDICSGQMPKSHAHMILRIDRLGIDYLALPDLAQQGEGSQLRNAIYLQGCLESNFHGFASLEAQAAATEIQHAHAH